MSGLFTKYFNLAIASRVENPSKVIFPKNVPRKITCLGQCSKKCSTPSLNLAKTLLCTKKGVWRDSTCPERNERSDRKI